MWSFVLIQFVIVSVFVIDGSSAVQDYEGYCVDHLSQGLSAFKECLLREGFNKKCKFETLPDTKEITAPSGGNATLSCIDNSDYNYWYYPWRAEGNSAYKFREDYITKATQFFSELRWEQKIFLTNISYVLTGLYTCYSRFYNPCRYVEQHYYLYIRDENILSLYNTQMFANDYIVNQYEELEIGCIPTSPDVSVDLFIRTSAHNESTKIVLDRLDENDVLYSYNPQQGFKTNDTLDVGIKIYTCIFSRNLKEENVTSRIIIKPLNPTVWQPPLVSRINIYNENDIGGRLGVRCTLKTNENVTIEWLTPQADSDPRIQTISESNSLGDSNEITSSFTLKEYSTTDIGVYYCIAKYEKMDFTISKILVLPDDSQAYFVSFSNGYYEITDLLSNVTGITATLHVRYRGYSSHTQPDMYWLKNDEQISLSNPKVYTQITDIGARIEIKNLTQTDFGLYTLVARDGKITRKIRVPFYNFGLHSAVVKVVDLDLGLVQCIAASYPKPRISWYSRSYNGNDLRSFQLQPMSEEYSTENGFQVISYINIDSTFSGELLCVSSNSIDKDIVSQKVEDPKIDLEIRGSNIKYFEDGEMRIDANMHDNLTLTCVVSLHRYSGELQWSREYVYFDNSNLEDFNTIYSKQRIITFYNISKNEEGRYTCKAFEKNNSGISHYRRIQVVVGDKKFLPNITHTNLDDDIKVPPLYKEFKLYCNVTGFPSPNVSWIKDGIMLESSDKFKIKDYNQSLVTNFTENDFGVYRCEAINSEGTVYKEIRLRSSSSFIIDYWYILFLIIVILCLALILIFTTIQVQNQKNVLKSVGLYNFEEGALDKLNPELQLSEQTSVLPYDTKWEIPEENIELGKKLGSGAFGIVTKGELKTTNEDGLYHCIPVAVKTFKKGSDFTCLKALASELKIMANLGLHLNIVNLLGACTKNIAKYELLIIVEYCKFGNLHQYLQKHRQNYIDQIDSAGKIDYSIGEDVLGKRYVTLTKESTGEPKFGETPEMSGSSEKLEEVPDEDYQNNDTQICTKDLIAWGFQVACGMEYLASRKVLHGDLAARNILLADSNIVKICDFGLAKNMYYEEIYKKTDKVPLPIKWMALESITSSIFSTQSDVWSFGVVLWEFFSLADTPYPTMEIDAAFVKKLSEGYRMESPQFAPKKLYNIMLDCWQEDPLLRPAFKELSEKIGAMLEEPVKNFYLDMNNNTYVKMNNETLNKNGQDYLNRVKAPNYANLPYVEENSCDFAMEVKTTTTMKAGLPNPCFDDSEDCDIIEDVETEFA